MSAVEIRSLALSSPTHCSADASKVPGHECRTDRTSLSGYCLKWAPSSPSQTSKPDPCSLILQAPEGAMHMPCLFVIAGPDEGCLHALDADKPATVGRGDDAILQLVDERSSRIHCCVQSSSVISSDLGMPVTQWVVSDAGSSNGTRVGSDFDPG